MLLVTNLWRMMQERCQWAETQKAWLEHYQRLLNVEFDWDPDHLSYQPPVEGPPIPVTIDMVKKAISQMKVGKALGPSGIVVEMIRAAGDMGPYMIRILAAAINHDGKVPSDWEQSFIVCLYKGKGDALIRCNYRGLKLTEQVMKILERIVDGLIRPVNRRFPVWLCPRQRHYRHNLYCQAAAREVSSCQQETLHGFRRPGEGVWSSTSEGHLVWRSGLCDWWRGCMHMRGAMSMLVRGIVKSLKWRLVFTKDQYSAHCSSSLCSGVPWEDLYADDLVIIAESLEECVRRLLTWKEAMEKKGLRVNAGKTKIMICGMGLDLLQSSGEFPCAVCHTGVGSNSIFCSGCKHWVHKKCSGLKRLKKDPDYRCTRCQGTARPLDGRPQKEVQVGPDKLEVVASFCY